MKKRVLALLLSVLMTLSLLPVSAFAVDVDSAELGEIIGTATEGEFTDKSADPNKDYEYTIVGDDGSQQTVTVAAEGETGDVDTTYGTIGKTTGSGATYYELVTNGAAGIESGKQYLIVSASSGTGYALTKTAGAAEVTITDSKITDVSDTAVFTLEANGSGYNLKDNGNTYLNPGNWNFSTSQSSGTAWTVATSNSAFQFKNVGKYNTYYIVFYSYTWGGSDHRGFSYSTDTSSQYNLYLFAKVTEPAGPVYKITWTTEAETLLNTCNGLNKDNYTEDSWTPFQKALKAANAAHDAESFATETEAKEALATMDALKTAYEALVMAEVYYPDIEWKRTKELKYNQTGKGDLLTGQTFTDEGDDGTYPKVYWNWDTVSKLTTDPTMTVWDYGTASQYSSKKSNSNIKAATWVHRNSNGSTPSWSCEASIRKFAGTFQWPEGYDLDDTAALVSVNDSYYKPIYDYIANSDNEEYKKATAGKYVLPANDDIYVFMYADGTTLTEANYMNYLVFWTGTSGKGVWSSGDNRRDDWGKTTPSTFNDIYANRSFHGVTPNLWASADETTTIQNLSNAIAGWDTTLMNQSDGWYTFADTAGIAKVLKNNYTTIDAGTTMHIDIYCFDNDSDGGMDQLKLKMERTPETHTDVEVRYYLDTVDDTGYLGNSFMQNVEVNTKITLQNGTDSNQLNYMKATAIAKAGNKTVTDGKQWGSVPYTVIAYKDNVINVLYTTGDSRYGTATYTYDFGVANQYSNVFADDIAELGAIKSITVPKSFADRVTVGKDANTITYTPKTVNISETVSLTLTFVNNTAKIIKDITFLPESNVMYEENMVTASTSWEKDGTTANRVVADNETDSIHGHTAAYDSDTKFSGGSALRATLTAKQVTGTATFSFTGTGFDLISECGTDTGMLVVGVKKANGDAVCGYLVDTYFCGDKDADGNDGYVSGTGTLDYQVPVVRNLELEYDSYTVTVAGYLASNAGAVVNKSAVATQSLSNAAPSVDEIFRAAGMSEYLDAGVEVSFMDDNSVLNGGTGPAVTTATPSFFSRVRSFFRGLASTQAATDESNEIYAYIDAFRVYQPLTDEDANANYVDTEKNTEYYSLYDFVKTSVSEIEDAEYLENVAVYVEYDGDTDSASIADYKDQGPENEVYLTPGSAIAFALSADDADFDWNKATFQLSAKCIDENAGVLSIDGNDPIVFSGTATEMYYEFKPQYDETLGRYVVIQNPNDADGILSLSALKLPNGVKAWASADVAEKVVKELESSGAENEFVPKQLTVKTVESLTYGRNTTINIKSSTEEGITVYVVMDNGDPVQVKATNTKAVAAGKADAYNYNYTVKSKTISIGTHTFQIYAEKDGVKSAPVTVTVTVTAK